VKPEKKSMLATAVVSSEESKKSIKTMAQKQPDKTTKAPQESDFEDDNKLNFDLDAVDPMRD